MYVYNNHVNGKDGHSNKLLIECIANVCPIYTELLIGGLLRSTKMRRLCKYYGDCEVVSPLRRSRRS